MQQTQKVQRLNWHQQDQAQAQGDAISHSHMVPGLRRQQKCHPALEFMALQPMAVQRPPKSAMHRLMQMRQRGLAPLHHASPSPMAREVWPYSHFIYVICTAHLDELPRIATS